MADVVDVAVAGGGPVGAAAALAFARAGYRVVLIDRNEPVRQRGRLGFDLRTFAVNEAARRELTALDAWGRFGVSPFTRVLVWEERGTRRIEFRAQELGRLDLGVIVEASEVQCALWERLREMPNATFVTGAGIESVACGDDCVRLRVGDRWLEARLLVAADGASSTVRRLLEVPASRRATDQEALVTIVEVERPHDDTAAQRFLHDGPLALLPLPTRGERHHCSLVWSSRIARARALAALPDDAFIVELEHASERLFGRVLAVDRRVTFGLEQMVVETCHPHPRVLLAGDAARVVHPLAGQGVNLGFEDVRGLGRTAARISPADPGGPGLWQRYALERRLRAETMVRAMDALMRVYAIDEPVFAWMRNVGVDWLNRAQPLKATLVRQALGI